MSIGAGALSVVLSLDGTKYKQGMTQAEFQAQKFARETAAQMKRVQRSARETKESFQNFGFEKLTAAAGRLAGVLSAGFGAAAFIRTADSVTVLNNQLKLATGSQEAATVAQAALFDIAQRSRVSFTELGATYAQIARASGELNLSSSQLLTVTEAIGNAMTISGGPVEGMKAALVQLTQGMSSGVLRGEELNSVMEQTPRLAKALADGLGVPIGKLREMGAAGELTSERVIVALQSQADVLKNELATSATTGAQAMTQLGNAVTKAVGDIDRAVGVTSAWAGVLRGASNDLSVFSQTMQASAAKGEGAFMQLANGAGALVGRAAFGAVEISANTVNSVINLLTANVLNLNENVRLLPANLQPAELALKTMGAQVKAAELKYQALSERLKTAPDNIYIKSELGNLARYIAALKEARAQASALTGAAFDGPVEYGNESKREASRQTEIKAQKNRVDALADFRKKYATAAEKTAATIKEWRDKLGPLFTPDMQALIESQFSSKSASRGGTGGAQKDPQAEAKSYLDSLQRQLQATRDLNIEETLLADVQAGRLGKVLPEKLEELRLVARQIDDARIFSEIEKDFESARLDAARATVRAREEQEALVKSMIDATPTAQLERQRYEMQLLAQAFESGKINAETFGEAASTRLGNVAEKQKEANDEAKAFGQIMTGAFEDAIIEGRKFSDVLKGLAQAFLRRQVTEPLAAAAGGALSGIFGGLFGGAPSFEGGGWTGDGPRSGGLDGKGGYLAMVHPKERITDTTMSGSGGGVVVNQYNTFSGSGTDKAELALWAKQVKQETIAAVQLQANRGGSFAQSVGRA